MIVVRFEIDVGNWWVFDSKFVFVCVEITALCRLWFDDEGFGN
jgi:hypothetical protein